jgi:hypothetical protein
MRRARLQSSLRAVAVSRDRLVRVDEPADPLRGRCIVASSVGAVGVTEALPILQVADDRRRGCRRAPRKPTPRSR